jgi:hypothetical protein
MQIREPQFGRSRVGAPDDEAKKGSRRTIWRIVAAFIAGLATGHAIKRSVAARRDEQLRRQLAAAELREDEQVER